MNAAAADDVTASGNGSVAVGTMSGGTIQMGITAEEAKALAAATGKELVTQLTQIVNRLNAQQGASSQAQEFSLGVVQGFLATIKGKQISRQDWPIVFGELSREYLKLGERIRGTPVTSDEIKNLVSRADVARKSGRLDEADALLAQASEHAIRDAKEQSQRTRESTRQAASLLASRASLALTRLERSQGADLMEQAFQLRRDDVDPSVMGWLVEAGDAWRKVGSTSRALRAYAQSRDVAYSHLSDGRRIETGWERVLSLSHERVGNTQTAQGDVVGALKSYQAALAIAQKRAAKDPVNTDWQRNLSVSHIKIGDTQTAQNDLVGALKSYQAAMAIHQTLAAKDPRNTDWQRDLSVSHERLGNTQTAQGDLVGALKSYQAAIAIAQKLAAKDPGNTDWQRDLSVSQERVGDAQKSLADALKLVPVSGAD